MGKVVTTEDLKNLRDSFRRQRKTVVFTNGVFDILHRGHVEYLCKAKALGDVLIVGINTDESVRHIKGFNRPIISEDDRAFIVSQLSPVDYVCLFNSDTPIGLISSLLPDVLTKGADWNMNTIVGKDIVEKTGGKVVTINLVPNCSTSTIIKRILQQFSTH